MPLLGLLLSVATLASRPTLELEPASGLLPPPMPRPEPPALTRTPLHERQPLELLVHGRVWAPFDTTPETASTGSARLGTGAGVNFRTGPYFSVGAEGSVLRVATLARRGASFELAAVGRVSLLEAGFVDPYLELALGYEVEQKPRASGGRDLTQGATARAGGGLDLLVARPLRVGASLAYREVARLPSSGCGWDCAPRARGGMLAGLVLTFAFGEPL